MPATQELAVGVELEGVIVRDYGLWFDVQTDAGIVRATLRGILKRERVKTDPAAVGDRVRVSVASLETDPPEGAIEEVEPRTRVLSRLARGTDDVEQVILANPDQLLAVYAIREPNPIAPDDRPDATDRRSPRATGGSLLQQD